MWVRPILTMSDQASAFGVERVAQGLHGRHQPLLDAERSGHVHRGWERVVGRLRHVDVVVGMDRLLAAQRLAGDLGAAVGDHLVDVHVELRAAAGHPDVQRKLVVVLAFENLVADRDDQVLLRVAEPPAFWFAIAAAFFTIA